MNETRNAAAAADHSDKPDATGHDHAGQPGPMMPDGTTPEQEESTPFEPERPGEGSTEETPEQFYENAVVPNPDVPPEGGATLPGETVPAREGDEVPGASAAETGHFAEEVAGPLSDEPAAAADAPEAAAPKDVAPEAETGAPAESGQPAAAPAAEPEEPLPPFSDLGLSEPLLQGIAEAGYVTPTPIQAQAIPVVLMGRDVLGVAQTGTGKTASFVLPMMDILSGSRAKARMPRSLILEPTRELALQVAENFVKYGKHLKLNHALLIGGESMDEQKAILNQGVDVLIATPGRLLDLFDRGRILLADCKILVIDEADRMLDMGFIPDVERIVGMLPPLRQTLFFSATMAPEIRKLADAFLSNPKEIKVSRAASVATTIVAGVVFCRTMEKREALRRLIRREQVKNALIFCNRKRDVDILYKSLKKHGFSVGSLHGDMDQSARFATLNSFKADELQLLVCSDVAARGIDIGGLSHVFNFDVPFHSEDYVHRIGRTGRAGREGHAYTLATPDDAKLLQAVEKLTGNPIPRIEIDGVDPVSEEEMEAAARSPRGGRGRREEPASRTRSVRPAPGRREEGRAPREEKA
ncbi:DEAD/DEAH box helicase, partial [Roseomonas mucosa]